MTEGEIAHFFTGKPVLKSGKGFDSTMSSGDPDEPSGYWHDKEGDTKAEIVFLV